MTGISSSWYNFAAVLSVSSPPIAIIQSILLLEILFLTFLIPSFILNGFVLDVFNIVPPLFFNWSISIFVRSIILLFSNKEFQPPIPPSIVVALLCHFYNPI